MKEEIKPIKGFPGYFISNLGHIYTEYRGTGRKQLKLHNHHSGYNYANIYKKGNGVSERYYIRVHRLVYSHFIGKLDDKLCIDHIDGNKKNNHSTNLQQITVKENIRKYWKKRRENEKNKVR
jgi:hypothetical protein